MNADIKKIFENALSCFSRMQDIDESGILKLKYDIEKYNFVRVLTSILIDKGFINKEIQLENLHTQLDQKDMNVDIFGFNNVTQATDDSTLLSNLYIEFMRKVIIPIINKDCYIQKTPTNRFSFPFAEGVVERFYHTDLMLGHPPEEINIWIPFTDTSKSESFKIMPLDISKSLFREYKFDLQSLKKAVLQDDGLYAFINDNSSNVILKPGEVLMFDSRCIHGVRKNRSEVSRVSMDVRIVPVEDYDNLPVKFVGSKSTKKQAHFIPGDYYSNDPIRIT